VKSQRAWKIVLVIYLIIIGCISAAAYTNHLHVSAMVGKTQADKLIHFVLLGGASFLARRASADARTRFLNLPIGPLIVGIAATIDECAQAFSPVRTFDYGDMAANISGVLVFGWLAGSRWFGPFIKDGLTSKQID
jgi:VanZ family protein